MGDSATSRIPVEIWESILRMVVTGMDVLNPDRYDVPAAKLLAISPYIGPYDQYKDYMAQILQLRLVCKDWDSFVFPFVELVTTVHRLPCTGNYQMDNINRPSRAIRIVAFSLHPLCRCRFGASCETCMALRDIGYNFVHYLHNKEDLSVKILEGLTGEGLCTLIESPDRFPSLDALIFHPEMEFFWPKSEIAAQRLSNLLRSLEYFIKGGNGAEVQWWKLPLLTTLVLKLYGYDIEGMLEEIHSIAPNLKFLSLPDKGEFNVEKPSRIWSFFPYLIAFACPMDFFLVHLPPPTHPLRYFLAVNVGGRILEKVRACVKGWENCRALMGRFKWIEEFECVHFETPLELDDETRSSFRRSSERLRGGLELKEMGVRYEDRCGLSFEEACDKFGGATPIASVKSFIDAVGIALGKEPIHTVCDGQLPLPADKTPLANSNEQE